MKVFTEFKDDEEGTAVEKLNEHIEILRSIAFGNPKINVVGYRVVRYEQLNQERTYILIEEET